METRARAKRGLAVYFGGVVVGSSLCEGYLLETGDPITAHPLVVLALMWTPAAASMLARLVLREGFADVSFLLRGAHGRRMLALAWLYPLVVAAVAYGVAWSTGLAAFAPPPMASLGLVSAAPGVKLAASIAINLTLGTVLSAISAAGEELGWRGYMLTRLVDAGVPRPVLVSGVIWAAWHLPLIVSGQYAAGPRPVLSAVLFAFSVTGAAYVAARVRLVSGSVWPAVVFHASWNALVQGTFDRFTRGGDAAHTTSIWIGESGVLVVAIDVLLAIVVVARPFAVRRTPGETPARQLSVRTA